MVIQRGARVFTHFGKVTYFSTVRMAVDVNKSIQEIKLTFYLHTRALYSELTDATNGSRIFFLSDLTTNRGGVKGLATKKK